VKLRANKFFIYLVVLIFLSGLLSGCAAFQNITKKQQGQQEAVQNQKVPVETAAARVDTIENTRKFSGTLKPVKDIMIIPQIPGKVSEIYVKVGQEVKEGDILMELEARDVEQQIAQAQAAYEASKASVELSQKRLNELESQKSKLENEIKKTDVQIEDAKNNLAGAKQAVENEIDKLHDLLQKGAVTQDKFDSQVAELNQRLQPLQQGLENLIKQRTVLEESRINIESAIKSLPYDSKTLDAQLNQARTALNTAKGAADKLKLYSPIDGIVSGLNVQKGQMATQTSPPVTIIDMTNLFLDIQVSEYYVAQIQTGQKIKVHVEAVGTEPVMGEIDWISPSTDARIQAYVVRIKIDNPSGKLRPGMFARADLVLERKENAILVPKRAIVRQGSASYVFVVAGDSVDKREIQVGMDDGEKIEVISGLKKGEQVVVKGHAYIKEGQEVYVVKQED
jgi:RND family efflux transporter MFP subunit